MTSDQVQRIIRTSVQAAVPALLTMIAALTTEVGQITEWWAPLVLAGLTVVSSLVHQKVRPVGVASAEETV